MHEGMEWAIARNVTEEPSVATEHAGSCICVHDRPGMCVGLRACAHDRAVARAALHAIGFYCARQKSSVATEEFLS